LAKRAPVPVATIGVSPTLPHAQTIDLGDRDLEGASVDQARKFREHLGIRRRAVLGRSSKCQIGSKIAYSWQCDIAVMRAAQKGIVHPNAARAKSLAAQAD
jgi:hypothetical protein